MKELEWSNVLAPIQSVFSHSVKPSFGDRAPLTILVDLPAGNPLRTIFPAEACEAHSIELSKAKRLIDVDEMQKQLDAVHEDVAERWTQHMFLYRDQATRRYNEKMHVRDANFDVSDFVLVTKIDHFDGHPWVRVESNLERTSTTVEQVA